MATFDFTITDFGKVYHVEVEYEANAVGWPVEGRELPDNVMAWEYDAEGRQVYLDPRCVMLWEEFGEQVPMTLFDRALYEYDMRYSMDVQPYVQQHKHLRKELTRVGV